MHRLLPLSVVVSRVDVPDELVQVLVPGPGADVVEVLPHGHEDVVGGVGGGPLSRGGDELSRPLVSVVVGEAPVVPDGLVVAEHVEAEAVRGAVTGEEGANHFGMLETT